MPDTTRATKKAAMTGEKEDTETTRTLALIGTLRLITVRDWVIARCTDATIAKDSRTDTKTGIEGIKPLESNWIIRSPIARSGLQCAVTTNSSTSDHTSTEQFCLCKVSALSCAFVDRH